MKRILSVMIILLILLSGCGKGGNNSDSISAESSTESSVGSSTDSSVKSSTGSSAESILGEDVQDSLHFYSQERIFDKFQYIALSEMDGNTVYIYGSMEENPAMYALYRCDIQAGSIEETGYLLEEDGLILALEAAKNNELWVIEYTQEKEGAKKQEGYQIHILSDQGAVLFEHEMITDYLPKDIFISQTDDKIYIWGGHYEDNCIFVYNRSGELLSQIKAGGVISDVVFSQKENSLFLVQEIGNTSTIQVLDENAGTINPVVQVEETTGSTFLSESETYSFHIDVNSVFMGFDVSTKTFTPIIDWMANGLEGHISDVFPYDNRYITVRRNAENQDVVAVLSETSALQGEKATLRLATVGHDNVVELAVANFNSSSQEYAIEIVDYSMYGEDGLTKMNMDIIAGDVPDIFLLDNGWLEGINPDPYIAMGLLEDLYPYMEKNLNMEDLWPSAIDALSQDNKCYLAVPGFSIHTILGRKNEIGRIKDKSYFDMMDYIKEESGNGQNVFGNGMGQLEFVDYMVSNYTGQFVDYNRKTCGFDSEEFISLLETAKDLEPYDQEYAEYVSISQGKQPITFQEIDGADDMEIFATLYKNDFDFAGLSMTPEYSFGMSQTSKYKEGVWKFLEWLYSQEFQQYITGIPMSRAAFEMKWDIHREDIEYSVEQAAPGIMIDADVLVEFLGLDERLALYQKDIELILDVDRIYREDADILNIINEEVPAYLEGVKDAGETAAIIQDRVQKYLEE